MAAPHPYYPRDLVIPGFVPGTWSMEAILGVFGIITAVIIVFSWLSSKKYTHLSTADRAVYCWWVATGTCHLILEGFFVAKLDLIRSTSTDFLTEVWKEYSKADSRYATRDVFVVSLEGFTAFLVGPLCFLVPLAMARKAAYRHSLQIILSMMQLYGVILYFVSSILEDNKHVSPGALYFWIYFVFMNSIWVVVPAFVVWRSAIAVNGAVGATDGKKKAS
eukprot:TRINITY_DN1170_c0_g1_i1.p1 TRINITY_DN1170_c0_g1~~TRINITY_DN1170_c0_g1_i1.p1  ORF type:complete len:220 (+),score=26.47 TRINITY_DN1170_c0_g1_i1:94-753(+)